MRAGFVPVINHMLADLRMKLGSALRGNQALDWMPLFSQAKQGDKHRDVMGEENKKKLSFREPENLSCFSIIS